MKRIIFCLKSFPGFGDMAKISIRMLAHGVLVFFSSYKDYSGPYRGTLYVTDSEELHAKIKKQGYDALALIDSKEDTSRFKTASYFIMNPYDTEFSYFDGAHKRFNNIPWTPFKTKRLLFRETIESDVDTFYEMYKDPAMTKYTESLYEDPLEEKKYVREYIEKVYKVQGFGIWTVIRKKDGKIIGRAGLTAREGFETFEVGFAIGTKYQNKGYAKEAVNGIVKFASKNELGNLTALVMEGNLASKHVLAHSGFKYRENVKLNGTDYEVWERLSIEKK